MKYLGVVGALLGLSLLGVPALADETKQPAPRVGQVVIESMGPASGTIPRVRTHYFHTLQKRVGMETEVTMSTLFYLSSAQMDTIRPFFPRSRGVPRVDDQKILSGIIYVLKFGLQWKDAPKEYGPYKTLYNRFVRWSKMGVFEKIFTALAENSQDTSLLMIDATHLKAHRTAASLRKKGLLPDVSDEQRED